MIVSNGKMGGVGAVTNDIDYYQLGMRIKHYRKKAGFSQEELADRVGSATSTIAHAENGTSKPSLPLLIKIARETGVTMDQLVCDSLPIARTYLDKDIADLLEDCSVEEKRMIRDIITAAKETLRRHR